jgi:predicted SprT family Zn-dependent metalloprotease
MICNKCSEHVSKVDTSLEDGEVRVEYLCVKCNSKMVAYITFDEFEEEYDNEF